MARPSDIYPSPYFSFLLDKSYLNPLILPTPDGYGPSPSTFGLADFHKLCSSMSGLFDGCGRRWWWWWWWWWCAPQCRWLVFLELTSWLWAREMCYRLVVYGRCDCLRFNTRGVLSDSMNSFDDIEFGSRSIVGVSFGFRDWYDVVQVNLECACC